MHVSAIGIEQRAEPSGDVIAVRGELDLTNAQQLAEALAATATSAVVLDLSALAFLDSAGIRAIDRARSRLESEARRLLIVAPAESRAGWTFRVAGLADELVLESLEVAKALAGSGNGASP